MNRYIHISRERGEREGRGRERGRGRGGREGGRGGERETLIHPVHVLFQFCRRVQIY